MPILSLLPCEMNFLKVYVIICVLASHSHTEGVKKIAVNNEVQSMFIVDKNGVN